MFNICTVYKLAGCSQSTCEKFERFASSKHREPFEQRVMCGIQSACGQVADLYNLERADIVASLYDYRSEHPFAKCGGCCYAAVDLNMKDFNLSNTSKCRVLGMLSKLQTLITAHVRAYVHDDVVVSIVETIHRPNDKRGESYQLYKTKKLAGSVVIGCDVRFEDELDEEFLNAGSDFQNEDCEMRDGWRVEEFRMRKKCLII